MADRLKGVTVTFESDIRDDDAKQIIDAIEMIKGVLTVTPSIRDHTDIMNRSRIREELENKLWEVLRRD